MPFHRISATDMLRAVETEVAWAQGVGYAWQCDAIISAEFLEELVRLAARAPYSEKKKVFDHA